MMERFRKTSDFGLKDEFLERAKPFLILVGMWERKEEDEEEKIVLESFLTDLNISYSRIHHFQNCIKKYQGKNKLSMKKEELEKVGSLILSFLSYFKKEELRRQDILDLVKMFSLKSAKGKENEIFFFSNWKIC